MRHMTGNNGRCCITHRTFKDQPYNSRVRRCSPRVRALAQQQSALGCIARRVCHIRLCACSCQVRRNTHCCVLTCTMTSIHRTARARRCMQKQVRNIRSTAPHLVLPSMTNSFFRGNFSVAANSSMPCLFSSRYKPYQAYTIQEKDPCK